LREDDRTPGNGGTGSKPAQNGNSNGKEDTRRFPIVLLPNLLTAGNLTCGFLAMTWIFRYQTGDFEPIHMAIRYILAAFVFDFFDGLLARAVGHTSAFGSEFDSLSDMVSFGVVPAFLVYRIVLQDFHPLGLLVAAAYLACSAIRLARFNVLTQRKAPGLEEEFVGFPIPTAAGLVVSVTLFMMWMAGRNHTFGKWQVVLPILMLVIGILMVSTIRYPAFKHMEWTATRSTLAFSFAVIVVILLALHFHVTLAGLFLTYMLFGLVRHLVRMLRRKATAA
jgi:CDP-diacylglycerol---serine O-phosphatidyltransferase